MTAYMLPSSEPTRGSSGEYTLGSFLYQARNTDVSLSTPIILRTFVPLVVSLCRARNTNASRETQTPATSGWGPNWIITLLRVLPSSEYTHPICRWVTPPHQVYTKSQLHWWGKAPTRKQSWTQLRSWVPTLGGPILLLGFPHSEHGSKS